MIKTQVIVKTQFGHHHFKIIIEKAVNRDTFLCTVPFLEDQFTRDELSYFYDEVIRLAVQKGYENITVPLYLPQALSMSLGDVLRLINEVNEPYDRLVILMASTSLINHEDITQLKDFIEVELVKEDEGDINPSISMHHSMAYLARDTEEALFDE